MRALWPAACLFEQKDARIEARDVQFMAALSLAASHGTDSEGCVLALPLSLQFSHPTLADAVAAPVVLLLQ